MPIINLRTILSLSNRFMLQNYAFFPKPSNYPPQMFRVSGTIARFSFLFSLPFQKHSLSLQAEGLEREGRGEVVAIIEKERTESL
jgi:hypothetical protein